jgi:hypothetical protein
MNFGRLLYTYIRSKIKAFKIELPKISIGTHEVVPQHEVTAKFNNEILHLTPSVEISRIIQM